MNNFLKDRTFLSFVSDIFCLVPDIFLDNMNNPKIVSTILVMKSSNIPITGSEEREVDGEYCCYSTSLLSITSHYYIERKS